MKILSITVRNINHLLYFDPENLDEAREALRIPALSPGWRGSFEKRLAEAKRQTENQKKPSDGRCCGP